MKIIKLNIFQELRRLPGTDSCSINTRYRYYWTSCYSWLSSSCRHLCYPDSDRHISLRAGNLMTLLEHLETRKSANQENFGLLPKIFHHLKSLPYWVLTSCSNPVNNQQGQRCVTLLRAKLNMLHRALFPINHRCLMGDLTPVTSQVLCN